MRAKLAADEDLNRSVGGFWRDVEAEIFSRFRSMIPQDPADRDKGPKVFEIHHEIAVGKECFLLRLDETGDPEDASEFTRRRLALTGDPAEFYAEFGEPEAEVDDAPEPA